MLPRSCQHTAPLLGRATARIKNGFKYLFQLCQIAYIYVSNVAKKMIKYLAHINAPELKGVTNKTQLINSIRRRPLRKSGILSISKKFGLSPTEIAQLMGVSIRTYHRQKGSSPVSIFASEIGIKLAELYEVGLTTFDRDEKALLTWFNSSIPAINNQVPLELIKTTLGIELVKDELVRIEHGVY